MTNPKRQRQRGRRLDDLDDNHRKHVRSPCDRPPITPTSLVGEFDRLGTPRYHRLRAKFRWDEVHEDTSGFHITLRHYELELEYTANGNDWFDAERYIVPRKDDNEPNNKAHFVIKGSIVGNLGYRWRVRAVADGGCKSLWTAFQNMGDPGGDNPPAPSAVTIYDGSLDRVVVDWDPTHTPDDDEILDEHIAHYACEISKRQDFTPIYKRDIFVHGTQRTFKVATVDLGSQFFARAWAVGTDKDKSAKVPAKLTGNNDPGALADGVTVDSPQQAKNPPGMITQWPGPLGKKPAGWLHCNGDSYSTTVYAELFAAIGYRYSHGATSGPFNVPDLRGRYFKGAKTYDVEGDPDDGYGYESLDESQRHDTHGKHERHKHKHHHRNKRRDHDSVPDSTSEDETGAHTHGVSGDTGGPSGGGITNIPAQGTRDAAGPSHGHASGTLSAGTNASKHQHGMKASKQQGTKATQQYPWVNIGGTLTPTPGPMGTVPSHGDHTDQYVEPELAGTVYDDSIVGGGRFDGGSWDGGETDSSGNYAVVDDDFTVASQNKGHKGHSRMKGHYIIKT